jgi:hypothetical protein
MPESKFVIELPELKNQNPKIEVLSVCFKLIYPRYLKRVEFHEFPQHIYLACNESQMAIIIHFFDIDIDLDKQILKYIKNVIDGWEFFLDKNIFEKAKIVVASRYNRPLTRLESKLEWDSTTKKRFGEVKNPELLLAELGLLKFTDFNKYSSEILKNSTIQ